MRTNRTMARYAAALCGASALLTLTGCQRNISGSYMARDQSVVVWLQLVRTPDNHLTGQLAATTIKPDGSIERDSSSLTGAVDGSNVTLSGSGFLGLQSFTLAGTFDGNTLTLTGGQPGAMTFKRSTIAAYQEQLADLNASAQQVVKGKADAEARQRTFQSQRSFVAGVDSLIQRMEQFDSAADVHLGRFPNAERGYAAVTAKVTEYVARERRLAGNPNASVARGQLSVAANQAAIMTEQMHNQTVSLESSMEGTIKPLADQATAFEQQCRAVASNTGNLTPNEVQNVHAACDRLAGADGPFRQRYNAMAGGLGHLEQVYQHERSAQEGLIQESERLE